MPRLASSETQALLECVGRINAVEHSADLASGVMAALQGVVPWESCFWNDIDTRAHRVERLVEPIEVRMPDENHLVERYLHQHPVYSYAQRTGDETAHMIADFVSRDAWRRTDLYNLMYRPRRIESQISFTFSPRSGQTIGVVLNRSGPAFGESQRLALNLLRPHLLAAGRRLHATMRLRAELAQAESIIDELEFGIVVLDGLGSIAFANRCGRRVLVEFFSDQRRRADALPESIFTWFASQRGSLTDELAPPASLTVERGGRSLCIRLLRDGATRMLLLSERAAPFDPAQLAPFGLTARETEVLGWLAQGKSDAEIAAIVDARPKTIGKHLERIYSKLGVESRTAAVARVLKAAH
jgi:DNA-binding CsgD family transcriptional regulator